MHKKEPSEREVAYRAHCSLNRKRAHDEPWNWIDRERVVPIVLGFINKIDRELGRADFAAGGRSDVKGSGRQTLCSLMGIGERYLFTILTEKPRWMSTRHRFQGWPRYLPLELVDRMFVAMDCVDLFHLDPEDGGFADVYFHPHITDQPLELELVAA